MTGKWRRAAAIVLMLCCLAGCGGKKMQAITLNNQNKPSASDPWIIADPTSENGGYFYCRSEKGGVSVAKMDNICDAEKAKGKLVWKPEEGKEYSAELWAPELHYIDGCWYIYVACDDGDNMHHRMYVLKGDEKDPTKKFTLAGKIGDESDKWAIDGTVLTYRGEHYFIWSGWEGDENVAQNIYIAHMKDACTIDSERVLLSQPEYPWEKNGFPLINEGPAALVSEDTAFIVYSASGSWTDYYCLGQLTLKGGDPMNPSDWEKSEEPVLQKTTGTYGPGHCSFAADAAGQLFVIYHANYIDGTGWQGRSLRMQPVEKFADGELTIGDALKPEEEFTMTIRK